MTGRERLSAVLNRRRHDRPAWTTLVDDTTRSRMPYALRDLHPFDFYRRIGCDILQFGNYGLPPESRVPLPSELRCEGVDVSEAVDDDGAGHRVRRTSFGTLTSTSRGGHPLRHPVASLADVVTLTRIWDAAQVVETIGHENAFRRVEQMIGDDGMFFPTVKPSPVQELLEFEMGMENFYALYQDHPKAVKILLDAMHRKRLEEYRILAARTPAEAVIPVENTSTTMISPAIYRELSLPHVRAYADIVHAAGKKIVLHMCGHLRALLPTLPETGLDAWNAVTPLSAGDTPFDLVLDRLGEDFVIFGGCYDAAMLHGSRSTKDDIRRYLDDLYTSRLRRAHMVGWFVADGLPVDLWRFEAVGEWMLRQ